MFVIPSSYPVDALPLGRNKMVINHLEKLFVTNDAATIIRELDVVHPAAKLLVMASQQQESEIGDGTNFVVVFAGELLVKAQYLLTMGLHPSEIVEGYEVARDKALTILEGGIICDLTAFSLHLSFPFAILSCFSEHVSLTAYCDS